MRFTDCGRCPPYQKFSGQCPPYQNYDGTDDSTGQWSGSYGRGQKGIYRQETTPVGSFEVVNAFGLSDMHGNVWEWCADRWHDNYEWAPRDGSAWLEGDSELYLLRGSSWYRNPRDCRSAYRYGGARVFRNYYFGFRVACSA